MKFRHMPCALLVNTNILNVLIVPSIEFETSQFDAVYAGLV